MSLLSMYSADEETRHCCQVAKFGIILREAKIVEAGEQNVGGSCV